MTAVVALHLLGRLRTPSMPSAIAFAALTRAGMHTRHGLRRCLHQSSARYAITNFEMPAMSPTMTEGGIASWKKNEGESFSAGDVLLEIETDKATIDVEAQEDGVLGKILYPDGTKNVPVGKVIAILAEEGDDISNLQPPREEKKSATEKSEAAAPTLSTSTPAPSPPPHPTIPISHSRPLFPSVYRLLAENSIANPEVIKGTGVRGMLTKGDVLAYLGKASGPLGTFKELASKSEELAKPGKKEEYKLPDGPTLRRLIASSMLQSSIATRNAAAPKLAADFDSIIADYLPPSNTSATSSTPLSPTSPYKQSAPDYLSGLY